MKIPDTSFNEEAGGEESEIIQENQYKNPYLKKDDVPKIEIKNKNEMIYDAKEYKIEEFIKPVEKLLIKEGDKYIEETCENH